MAACQALLQIEPLLAAADDDLLDTLRRATEQPQTRVIGVIGANGTIAGVLPVVAVAQAIVARVVPESLLANIADIADVARFGHQVEARVVRDVMLPPAVVAADANIGEAFQLMQQRHLSGLYVVDLDNRPVGYLDLLELAIRYVEALEGDEDHPDARERRQVVDPPDPTLT